MMQRLLSLITAVATLFTSLAAVTPRLGAASNPIATPTALVRFYFHALDTGQCDLAYEFADTRGQSLSAFRRDCRSISRVTIERLEDPAYRLRPQTAAYTCLAVRYTFYRRTGTATSYGGWYLMERTLGPAWHILHPLSHVTRGGRAILLTRDQCDGHLPSYVHPGAGTVISGSAFLSATTGWIALSTSGSYLPNGSCSHAIGSNCEAASTTVYRTEDSGRHWTELLHIETSVGPPVWIRLFSSRTALVAATVGPLTVTSNYHFIAALFSTRDGGRHWQRWSLPKNYATAKGTISFPDARHGWLWCCGDGAMGSMSVYVYRTADGGHHWSRVACTAFPNPTPGYSCARPSGIGLGGDKEDLIFTDARAGWLTVHENTGVPDLYHTAGGGVSWHPQNVGLPPGVARPCAKQQVFPQGELLDPQFCDPTGVLPETVGFYRPKPRATWSRLSVFRSADGGRSWPSVLHTPVSGLVTFWQALDARHWVFLSASPGSQQSLWSTANAGASWTEQRVDLPAGHTLVGFDLSNPRDGWGTAQRHGDAQTSAFVTILLHTADGGAHWMDVRLPGYSVKLPR